jgi:hypothetical protein
MFSYSRIACMLFPWMLAAQACTTKEVISHLLPVDAGEAKDTGEMAVAHDASGSDADDTGTALSDAGGPHDADTTPSDGAAPHDADTTPSDGAAPHDAGVIHARDASTSTGAACVCADPAATCVIHSGPFPGSCQKGPESDPMAPDAVPPCVRADINCNALTACPTGYSCQNLGPPNNTSGCMCTDSSICGVVCSASGACPCGLVCSASNHCVPCAFSNNCPPAYICHDFGRCGPPVGSGGTSANGTSCQSGDECLGGACAGVCTQKCRSNADCQGGLICVESISDNNGCVLPQNCSSPTCTAPSDTCSIYRTPGNTNCSTWCATETDCPGGRCLASTADSGHPDAPFLLYRVCLSGGRACMDSEFEIVQSPDPASLSGPLFCSAGSSCLNTADCEASYPVCLIPMSGLQWGVCGRNP